ncbi:MAG: hypothetical protein NTV49_13820 [Kiritimatiellaeota bacterium]|nr:hypothetical protein [Kiritimatiellota bacterium]
MHKSIIAVLVMSALGMGSARPAVAQAPPAVEGRYVQVQLPGNGKNLSLAEVQVFSGATKVALKKPTVQNSTGFGADAQRAVDGNTNGMWENNSITHSAENVTDPTWEVDFGKPVAMPLLIKDSPKCALVNVGQPDESRILMAPLAVAAGGWGRLPAWHSKDDPNYKKMVELVAKCIVRNPNENDNGWQPKWNQGGGARNPGPCRAPGVRHGQLHPA